MKYLKQILALTALTLVVGCARFSSTTQTYNSAGQITSQTTMSDTTLFDSSSDITKARNAVNPTNGFSGSSVGSIDNQSSSTNFMNFLQSAIVAWPK